MRRMEKKRLAALGLCGVLLLGTAVPAQAQARGSAAVQEAADGILAWGKGAFGSADGNLFSGGFLEQAGGPVADWFAFAAGRYGLSDGGGAYLKAAADYVNGKYQEEHKLDRSKATEWHRIALTVLALGGDPAAFGRGPDGQPVNLIADGTYNRENLGKQGINGWIYGLLALDAGDTVVPSGAANTRESIGQALLSKQLPDGGFALTGKTADPDVTAAALQALAPYANDERLWPVNGTADKKSMRQAVDEAVRALSALQRPDGHFSTMGDPTCESAAQTVIALCSLGIDPQTDPRFIKNGKSVADALFSYRQPDGGFSHLASGRSDALATAQAFCALAALHRFQSGLRRLFDVRPEWTAAQRQVLRSAIKAIDALPDRPDKAQLTAAENAYAAVPEEERSYVSNYGKLAAAREALKAPPSSPAAPSGTSAGSRPRPSWTQGRTAESLPPAAGTTAGSTASSLAPTGACTSRTAAGVPSVQKPEIPPPGRRWLAPLMAGGGVFVIGMALVLIRRYRERGAGSQAPDGEEGQ